METEKEEDPFASIIKFCQPTASQEAKFSYCPLAREFENYADSQPDQFSPSTGPTLSDPTGMLPGSVQDGAEHHAHPHLSSSEDQNLNEGLGAETKRGLLDVLKAMFDDKDGGCEDEDFLETAKRRGLTFPKPRWWASDEQQGV